MKTPQRIFFDQAGGGTYRGAGSGLWKVEQLVQVFDYAYRKRNVDRKYYGGSNEWRCAQTWRYNCEYTQTAQSVYYLHDPSPTNHDGDSEVEPYYEIAKNKWLKQSEFNALVLAPVADPKVELSWEEAWGKFSPQFYGEKTGEWGPRNDYVYSESITGSTKNSRMGDICTTLKGEGTFIYAIGFEIPAGGTAENNLRGCASSLEHYYRAQGLNITDAFSSIAANVQNLRLTQ